MKVILRFIPVCVILFVQCAVEPPEERFASCFDAILRNDLVQVHGYFVFMDRSTIAADEFISMYSFTLDEHRFVEQHQDRIVFLLDRVDIDGDTLRAHLIIHAPLFMGEILNLLFFTIDTIVDMDIRDEMDSAAVCLRSYQGMLTMANEDRSWYIYGNWEEQRQIETAQAQDRLDYMAEHIKISGVKMYYAKDGKPRLSALLKNQGDRSLSDVEVYIVGYTTAHEPCFTATAHPLGSEPLGSKKTRWFSIDISQAPANWSGKVETQVLNCAFTKGP
ncbi:hypothetical protein JXB22_06515 [candidate division WOR-3 bacterium]|nr:hypothetical protein [candidate division WOR-3 bacterium]